MKYVLLTLLLLAAQNDTIAQEYCDYPDLFVQQSSAANNVFFEYIAYDTGCANPSGNNDTCHVYIRQPIDNLNDKLPTRPTILSIHGLCELGDIWGPLCDAWSSYIFFNELLAPYLEYGFTIASVQYDQSVDEFQIPDVCQTPIASFAETHYRAIVQFRTAMQAVYDQAENYGIDRDNIFLLGNSQGGMAVFQSAFLEDSEEFFEAFPQFAYLEEVYGPIPARIPIKGIILLSGFAYSLDFMSLDECIPIKIGHGVCDSIIPFENGTPFFCPTSDYPVIHGGFDIAARAQDVGCPYSMHTINDMGHGWPDNVQQYFAEETRAWIKEKILCGTPPQEQFFFDAEPDLVICENGDVISYVDELLEKPTFRVFPNPFSDALTIKIQDPDNRHFTARIFGLDGKLIREVSVLSRQMVEVGDLLPGLYFLEIRSEAGDVVYWEKVVGF